MIVSNVLWVAYTLYMNFMNPMIAIANPDAYEIDNKTNGNMDWSIAK